MKTNNILKKNFNLLLSGQFVSSLGTGIYGIVIVLYLKEVTGSGATMGLVRAIAIIPALLIGPFAGTIADLTSRKTIIVLSDLLNGIIMILLSLFGLSIINSLGIVYFFDIPIDLTKSKIEIWMIVVATVLSSISTAFYRPAVGGMIPNIIPESKLKQANSLIQTSNSVSRLVGNSTGGILMGIIGFPLIVFFNGISFILSGIQECFINENKKETKKSSFKTSLFIKETKEGVRYIKKEKGLYKTVLSFLVINTLTPSLIISLPFFIEDVLHLPTEFYGYVVASSMVGGILGAITYGLLKTTSSHDYIIFSIAFLCIPILLFCVYFTNSVIILFTIAFIVTFLLSIIGILCNTIIQKKVASDKLSRVLSILGNISMAFMPLSFVLSGMLVDLINQNIRMFFIINSLFFLVVSIFTIRSEEVRSFIKD